MPDVRWFILARRDRKATALVTVVKRGSEPNRLVAAFADYLACETGNSYAGWYAGECRDLLRRDYELRLYRMCTDQDYNTAFPAGADKMVWYKDAGEVAMHSAPEDTGKDLALSFRSSTFGSGSHTTASQNAFNLLYKGVDVYRIRAIIRISAMLII